MSVILLGLGYLLLAAVGAACWGLATRRLAPRDRVRVGAKDREPPRRRWTRCAAGTRDGHVAPRPAGSGIRAGEGGRRAADQCGGVDRSRRRCGGCRAGPGPSPRRDASTAGAFAAADRRGRRGDRPHRCRRRAGRDLLPRSSSLAVVVGTGTVVTLVRSRGSGGSRRPALAAGAAAIAVIAGIGVVGFVTMSGAGALQTARVRPRDRARPRSRAARRHPGSGGRPVTDLTTRTTAPNRPGETIEVALRAQQQDVDLPSGRSIEAWTFGALAGPAIVARVGDTLSVRLSNIDVDAGATVHWHGYPVAERVRRRRRSDSGRGASGRASSAPRSSMTQAGHVLVPHPPARLAGRRARTVRHARRAARRPVPTEDVDLTLPVHTFSGTVVLGASDVLDERVVQPGDSVRLRLINTDQTPQTFAVQGAPFRVAALDGMDVATDALVDRSLVVAAGGRVDVVLEMPATPVRVGVASDRERRDRPGAAAGDDVPALVIPRRPSIRSPTSSRPPLDARDPRSARRGGDRRALWTVTGSMSSGR